MTSSANETAAAESRVRLLQLSVTDMERYARLARVLTAAGGGNFLDLAAGDGSFSLLLRRLPGRWTTVALDPEVADGLRSAVSPESVHELRDGAIPFPDQSFDFVVLPDVLPAVNDDYAFIRECHRVLKPKSFLLCTVPNLKPWSLARSLRHLLGLSDLKLGFVRPGYTERNLYDLFKDGYDIVEASTWSRFFLETAGAVTQVVAGAAWNRAGAGRGLEDPSAHGRAMTLLRLCRPFARFAVVLDRLLPFTRGHQRMALIKSRMWIPRREVKIRDGRSIADATINTKIGTAKEF